MVNSGGNKRHYFWVDNIKFAACVLVVLGHYWMSAVVSGIARDGTAYELIIQSVYTFHVPVFFVCSGFLYQKSNRVHSAKSWGKNVLTKLLNLGVPYFTFEAATLVIKKIFADDVNNQAGDILKTLFLSPIAPYWYLYALFFMFVFIPCISTKKQGAILLASALMLKIITIICSYSGVTLPYIINSTAGRMIWFAIGMCCAVDLFDLKARAAKIFMFIACAAAIILCICLYREQNLDIATQFCIGLLFVISIITAAQNYETPSVNKISAKFSDYFMPVYVMHTIFAAGVRIVLLKAGITNLFVHTVLGLAASFAVPIIIYQIALRVPIIMLFIYPQRAIRQMKAKKKAA